jgi:hypothetical protein
MFRVAIDFGKQHTVPFYTLAHSAPRLADLRHAAVELPCHRRTYGFSISTMYTTLNPGIRISHSECSSQ